VEEVMPAKLALDLHYVRERSLALDLHIIAATMLRIVRQG
jgi:lipopolysaccharide/colanic/teichoic acid biosynthesis glycosyltransferase